MAIEETVGVMAELVNAGTVRHLGSFEASAATLRRIDQARCSAAGNCYDDQFRRTCDVLDIEVAAPYAPSIRSASSGVMSASSVEKS